MITWSTNLRELSSGSATNVHYYGTLHEEETIIMLTATDASGLSASDELKITVEQNEYPTVEITQPLSGESFPFDSSIRFVAEESDKEDDENDLMIEWISSMDGQLSSESVVSNGEIEAYFSGLSGRAQDYSVGY